MPEVAAGAGAQVTTGAAACMHACCGSGALVPNSPMPLLPRCPSFKSLAEAMSK